MDARAFLTKMLRKGLITKDQILGRSLNRDDIDQYAEGFNNRLKNYLKENNKVGFDYVFLSFDPTGKVAAVSRNSEAFASDELVIIVDDVGEKEITGTPSFLAKSKRIAFWLPSQTSAVHWHGCIIVGEKPMKVQVFYAT